MQSTQQCDTVTAARDEHTKQMHTIRAPVVESAFIKGIDGHTVM